MADIYQRNTNGMTYKDQALLEMMTLDRDVARLQARTARAEFDYK